MLRARAEKGGVVLLTASRDIEHSVAEGPPTDIDRNANVGDRFRLSSTCNTASFTAVDLTLSVSTLEFVNRASVLARRDSP